MAIYYRVDILASQHNAVTAAITNVFIDAAEAKAYKTDLTENQGHSEADVWLTETRA